MKTCINISYPNKVRFRKKVHSQASDHDWFFLNLFSKRPREKVFSDLFFKHMRAKKEMERKKKRKRKKRRNKYSLIFPEIYLQLTNYDANSPEFRHFLRKRPKSVRLIILKISEISQRKLSNFSENDFPKIRKEFLKN